VFPPDEVRHNDAYRKMRFLLPHIGMTTIESRTTIGMVALDNIDAVFNGTRAPSLAKADSL
jgi:lactate dehydrogenase-like 2-hydroxyacid dehydrogenase